MSLLTRTFSNTWISKYGTYVMGELVQPWNSFPLPPSHLAPLPVVSPQKEDPNIGNPFISG